LGIGDWGLGIGPNPQSPIPNPQSPIPNPQSPFKIEFRFSNNKLNFFIILLNIKIINLNKVKLIGNGQR
jgi:hypothetical protein